LRAIRFRSQRARDRSRPLGHLFADALLQDLGERGVPGSSPAYSRMRTTAAGRRSKASARRAKPAARRRPSGCVEERHFVGAPEILALEIEADRRIMICRSSATSSCCFSAAAVFSLASTASVSCRSWSSLASVGCEALVSNWLSPAGCQTRTVLEDDVDQHLRILVAGSDPTAIAGWLAWVCAKTGKQKAAAHKSEVSVRIKTSSGRKNRSRQSIDGIWAGESRRRQRLAPRGSSFGVSSRATRSPWRPRSRGIL